ncbi:MAG: transporter substrate-binding domain-containing protein [Desulfosarcina sp.]|nr:transporter substrate-binding domain-containing protein [Desulfosarcina sp.]MBC2742807.1 transporter substrate-binding domain-containing protein [Desulfosarcina sp.]MBC2765717.1 transporter substrate-binding domain-containing protein [Desulfosarcina sp.]
MNPMGTVGKMKDGWRSYVYSLIVFLAVSLPTPASGQKQLRIGVPLGFPSFSYQDESEVQGYSVDILDILCEGLSTEPRYLVGRHADLLRALKDGDLELVIGVVMDENQRQQFNYMEILIYVKRYLFVHHPSEKTNQKVNMGVNSVVIRGQPYVAPGIADRGGNFIQARSTKEALMMVNSGQAQEFVDYSDQLATYLIGKHGLQNVRQAGVQMGRFPFTMIIAKDNVPLSSGLSKALGQAIKNGQLGQVREKWLGKSYASYLWQRFAPLFILFAAMIAVIVLLFFTWHIALKRKVTQITSRLRVSEERYRQLIESSPDMVFLINKKGWIRLANHSASERLLIPQDQLLLSKLQALVVYRDAAKFNTFLKQLFSHRMASLETKLTNFSGREINVEFVAARLRSSSEEERLVCCFARDLTKRKLMERELIASERLATIGKMAGGVAHEVNNPIGIILAHAEDLISGELDDTEAIDSLKAIRRNALRAGNITRALLDQASSDDLEKVEVDVAVVLEECLYFLKPRLKKISVIRELEIEKHWIRGDENQLQQVFINLLLNAIESMAGEGTLRVSVAEGQVETDRCHRIRIEDSGKGIPAEYRPHIFDPFFTRGKTQGVGLGLFVAERILKNHGGKIAAENSVLGGTEMNVDLPVNPERINGNAPADC